MTIRKTLIVYLVAIIFIFCVGFSGTFLVWYVQQSQQKISTPNPQQRANSIYSEFVRIERCYEEISEQEFASFVRCRPRRIRFNPGDFTELLELAKRGLRAEVAAPFKQLVRIQHYLHIIAELETNVQVTGMKRQQSVHSI
jgi:hypothetical protein